MAGSTWRPHLIEVHPSRGVVIGALGDHSGGGPAEVLLILDLGYPVKNHDAAVEQLAKAEEAGFSSVLSLEEVYNPVEDWSYKAVLGRRPQDTHITVLARNETRLVYDGIFMSSPAWFAEEARSYSAAVAIGNFCFIDSGVDNPNFFNGHVQALAEAAIATSQVLGGSIARTTDQTA